MIDSYRNEILKLFRKQLKNLHLSLLASFDEVLKDTITKDDSEFDNFTSDKRREHENVFTAAARKTAIDSDDANWGWDDEFQELKSGLVEKIKACGKERPGPEPIRATERERFTSTKLMETRATLYRDGKLMVEADTDNSTFDHALRGRVLLIVLDKAGSTIGVTNEMSCTLRGGFNPFGPPRCGRDVFSQQFPRDVGRRAERLHIYQKDANSPGHHLEKIFNAAVVAAAAIAVVI